MSYPGLPYPTLRRWQRVFSAVTPRRLRLSTPAVWKAATHAASRPEARLQQRRIGAVELAPLGSTETTRSRWGQNPVRGRHQAAGCFETWCQK